MTRLADFAFSPFAAGLVGGVITGMFAPNTRWNKLGPFISFACWVLLSTALIAFLSEHALDAIPMGLAISGLWGIIPFALTFSIGLFVTERLRAYIVSLGKSGTFIRCRAMGNYFFRGNLSTQSACAMTGFSLWSLQ